MYLIQMSIGLSKYWLGTFGKNKTPYWSGILQNAKTFDDEQTASDYAYAESTMECEIIKITYE